MTRWTLLDIARASRDHGELRLYQRGEEFSIRAGDCELMNSRVHGSEDALGELACARIADRPRPRVLIGGLGMGYTLSAALQALNAESQVVVAELVSAVVVWNRGPLGNLAGHPLRDQRVTVREGDVAQILRAEQRAYNAILLDVDNGPKGLTWKRNYWLYGLSGLGVAFAALRPGGLLAVWSADPDQAFRHRLRKIGFKVDEVRVRSRGARGGARHTVYLAGRRALHNLNDNCRVTLTGRHLKPTFCVEKT
jgi:spermidine synthase